MTAAGEMLERGERTQLWSWTKLGSDAGLPPTGWEVPELLHGGAWRVREASLGMEECLLFPRPAGP